MVMGVNETILLEHLCHARAPVRSGIEDGPFVVGIGGREMVVEATIGRAVAAEGFPRRVKKLAFV